MLTDRELLKVIQDFRESDWTAVRLVHDDLDIRLVKRSPGQPLPAEFGESVDPGSRPAHATAVPSRAVQHEAGTPSPEAVVATDPQPAPSSAEPVTSGEEASNPAGGGDLEQEQFIRAGTLGSFWVAPAPGAEPFVQPGDSVEPGQIVAIIEVMKLMTEVYADHAGTVAEVLAQNGDLVQAGQPLFRIVPKVSRS
jgi:acetyl-CoA carboxylase biotin carboxyl carrier protein